MSSTTKEAMGSNDAAAGSNAQKTTLKKHAVVCLFFPSLNLSLSLKCCLPGLQKNLF